MTFLKKFYKTVFKYDLLNKFTYDKTKNLPAIKKIILNFGCKNTKLKNLAASFLALELISCQKGILTKTRKSNLFLKIRKGNPVGCKVVLKNKQMFHFLERNLNEILTKEKNVYKIDLSPLVKKSFFSYEIHNKFTFNELEKHYYLFNDLEKLDITIVLNLKFKKELIFLLKSFKFS
jgi:large subunit ribosomal protein L5